MPDYCCVPGCKTSGSGHRFPSDQEMKKKWVAAIKRLDPVSRKPWQPSQRSVVCSKHFTDEDYSSTLLGNYKFLLFSEQYTLP